MGIKYRMLNLVWIGFMSSWSDCGVKSTWITQTNNILFPFYTSYICLGIELASQPTTLLHTLFMSCFFNLSLFFTHDLDQRQVKFTEGGRENLENGAVAQLVWRKCEGAARYTKVESSSPSHNFAASAKHLKKISKGGQNKWFRKIGPNNLATFDVCIINKTEHVYTDTSSSRFLSSRTTSL